jgi:hypothetical protein
MARPTVGSTVLPILALAVGILIGFYGLRLPAGKQASLQEAAEDVGNDIVDALGSFWSWGRGEAEDELAEAARSVAADRLQSALGPAAAPKSDGAAAADDAPGGEGDADAETLTPEPAGEGAEGEAEAAPPPTTRTPEEQKARSREVLSEFVRNSGDKPVRIVGVADDATLAVQRDEGGAAVPVKLWGVPADPVIAQAMRDKFLNRRFVMKPADPAFEPSGVPVVVIWPVPLTHRPGDEIATPEDMSLNAVIQRILKGRRR